MHFRFRAIVVASSLFLAIACLGGGGDQCLNPIPDFPSCGSKDDSGFHSGGTSSSAGAGSGIDTPTFGGSPATAAGGSGFPGGSAKGGAANEQAAGSRGDDVGGAGGDSAIDPNASEAGAAGAAGSLADRP